MNDQQQLLSSFKNHLNTLGYAKETVIHAGKSVDQYRDYLKQTHQLLEAADSKTVADYFDYLHHRPNQKRSGGLSPRYIEKHRQGLSLFYDYLDLTKVIIVPQITFPEIKKGASKPIKVLSKDQIQMLFQACENNLLGERNRAMMALYYGCGLRKQEGILLNVEDLDLDKGQLLVRRTKTGYQRYVPISDPVIKILENYLYNSREKLLPSSKSERAVLVTISGRRLSGASAVYILKKLATSAKIKDKPSLHTLRHSIATHLLQSGMPLESISLFLGHRSLDSTQIYLHVQNEAI